MSEMIGITEEDWIICFGIIKNRNKALWNTLTSKYGPAIEVKELITIKESVDSKVLYTLVPSELQFLNNNIALFMQIEPIYNYLMNWKSDLKNNIYSNIEIIKSFKDEITHKDIINWYFLRYKVLLILKTLSYQSKDKIFLNNLFKCFQILIVSHFSFNEDMPTNYVRTVTETMIFRFLKNNLLTNIKGQKQEYGRIIKPFLKKCNNNHKTLNTNARKFAKIHFRTVTHILNLSLLDTNVELNNMKSLVIIENICLLIESLSHLLILINGVIVNKNPKKAYEKIYLKRLKIISNKYINDISNEFNKVHLSPKQKYKFLNISIDTLLTVISQINWKIIQDRQNYQSQMFLKKIDSKRISIQSILLMSGDLDLTATFRLTNWPQIR
ncbi:hypothetical protein Kpol_1070p30 [Vanderwaltozyma polyspora DSM 70294]|uniref:Uncharacterized protein n=1 Tax=Vanderwaltozyma polyspora (strain ATCC 22028 / DSM 70294 / BCRC 21397 / CBS 2163 / NBRC 10782 / NRRL Y-8283 / UCD 57-17) TaxID=436907 RepID=A7TNN0_VANPO|nr:uncharacterized protein Kpol_1070p30 [Vanderwaltozyma polyspora DSM 70294]EDO16147.1 hypothetical protein Kpol_1070p30 [Vanderwaltozyma polyspora DSM 70294]